MSVERLLQHFSHCPPMSVLDLGCGKGALVAALRSQGYDAYGCDIAGSKASAFVGDADSENRLRAIEPHPYRLPFDDASFDCVLSSQVLEHVMDYESTFKEIHRVLKPGGISLHTFPSRYGLIEPHVLVPLASIFRNRPWLQLWARLGIRNQFQHGKRTSEVVRLNHDYLHAHTNYLTQAQIKHHARIFSHASFVESVFLLPGTEERRRRSLKKHLFVALGGDRLRAWILGTFVMRALYLRK